MQITQPALSEVERALAKYEREVAELERDSIIRPLTANTYLLHAQNFVRWLKDEFEPGARNKRR